MKHSIFLEEKLIYPIKSKKKKEDKLTYWAQYIEYLLKNDLLHSDQKNLLEIVKKCSKQSKYRILIDRFVEL